MDQRPPFTVFTTSGVRRASAVWQSAATQPSWISRVVLMTFILVIAVPIFLLVALALVAASLVFGVLWGVNFLMLKVKGVLPHNDGRKNVRVIQRRDG
ncbi:MAG: hypothetical protein O7G85_07335 [Planctomycetota bacterium]|nr:hypothetical protein [Planctomycetota bacterium]